MSPGVVRLDCRSFRDEKVPTLVPARTHLLHLCRPFDLIRLRVFGALLSLQRIYDKSVSVFADFSSLASYSSHFTMRRV